MHYFIINKLYNVSVKETTFILKGGAGNQLFVIYAGLYFKSFSGSNVSFTYRPSGNYTESSSVLEVLKFVPNLKVLPLDSSPPSISERAGQFLRNQSKFYNRLFNDFSVNYVSPELGLDPEILKIRIHKKIYGYFQTFYYFDELIKIGISKPTLKSTSNWYDDNLLKINTELPIIMHIRRGDYLKHADIYQYLDINYYANAIDSLPKELSTNPIWIFSDDQKSAHELTRHLPNRKYLVMDQVNQKAIEVLFLMSAGVSHIIANSTFSWWGAKLSSNSSHVVAPKTWFKDRPTPKDLLPKNWYYI